jgi:sugar phosphate isomerase/epimerase
MKYSFMSFSCPELSLDDMLSVAKRFGYDGIEPRLDAGHKHGVEVGLAESVSDRFRAKSESVGIPIWCLATSCRFADPADSEKQVEEALERIELAGELGAHRIRVFGGRFPDDVSREDAIQQVGESLGKLADRARERDVVVCMETHDAWCNPVHVAEVMERVDHPNIGVNWDIMHPVRNGFATIEESFETLSGWVKHVHFHDGVVTDGKLQLVPIGEGTIDHRAAVGLLKGANYDGYLSGEWIGWEPWSAHLPRELATMKGYEP